jgi:hypothetical protein
LLKCAILLDRGFSRKIYFYFPKTEFFDFIPHKEGVMNTLSIFKNLRNIIVILVFFTFASPAFSWWFPPPPPMPKAWKVVDFESLEVGTPLAWYDGKSITTQFKNGSGIIFSACPVSILPADWNVFPTGLAEYDGGTPANLVIAEEVSFPEGILRFVGRPYNPWVVSFPFEKVVAVQTTLIDKEDNTGAPVTHTMYVFDRTGVIVFSQGVIDNGLIGPMVFSFDITNYALIHPRASIAKVLFTSSEGTMLSKFAYRPK